MKIPYLPFIYYKYDDNEDFKRVTCFGGMDLSSLKSVRYYIDDCLGHLDVNKYFDFLKSVFDIEFGFVFNTVEKNVKNGNVENVVDISLDLSSFSRVQSLTILTLLRYIQEFPEIVEKTTKNEANWESFKDGHKRWNKIREHIKGSQMDVKVKYDNAYGHGIACTDYNKSHCMQDNFCSLEKFKLNFSKAQAGYVKELFKQENS
jgi:hypothetical protein